MCYRINALKDDDTLTDVEKVNALFANFSRIGESEMMTPMLVAEKMWSVVSDADIDRAVAGKGWGSLLGFGEEIGEFSIAVYNRMKDMGYAHGDIARVIGCIPCSPIAYEMCMKTYRMLGLDSRNVARHFDAYTLYDKISADEKDGGYAYDYKKIAYALRVSKSGHLCDVTLDGKQGEEEKKEMTINFKAIVGNPPYQKNANGDSQGSDAIYDEFMDLCYELTDGKAVLITPARWMSNAGKTSKKWNKEKLEDVHLQVVEHWVKGDEIFPGTDIKGGVVITEYDKNNEIGPIGVFTSFHQLNSIIKKTQSEDFVSFQNIVYSRTLYRLTDKMHAENPDAVTRQSKGHPYDMSTNIFEVLPDIFHDEKPNDGEEYIRIYGRKDGERTYQWIKRSYVNTPDNLPLWKVLIPKSNGSGALGEVLSTPLVGEPLVGEPLVGEPLVGEPLVGHTETFMSIGGTASKSENEALFKYVKSKFCRVLLGVKKTTQDNPPDRWYYIPLQDFTENSDIDWSKTIAEIDQQLYEKYGLNEEEIAFIETKVKEMK